MLQYVDFGLHSNMDSRLGAPGRSLRNKTAAPRKETWLCCSNAGSGAESILKSLGVDVVVSSGGPRLHEPPNCRHSCCSEEANADQVIVMPNNSNIRMAAGCCKRM